MLHVRAALLADAPVIAAFQQAMAWETEKLRLDEATLASGVWSVLADPAKGQYFVAEDLGDAPDVPAPAALSASQPAPLPGAVVGSLMITREYSDWRDGWFWWIQSVYVVEAWRRRGVFRSLYRFVQQLASQSPGVCGLRLYVDHDNHKAHRTYELVGMQRARYTMFESRTVPSGTE